MMEGDVRYPPPDPNDPFAPLWVLRKTVASSSTSSRRPATAESSFLSNASPSPQPSSGLLLASPIWPASPSPGRRGPSSPVPPSPTLSYISLHTSASRSRGHAPQPSLAFTSSFDEFGRQYPRHQQAPVVGSKDQAPVPEKVHRKTRSKLSLLFRRPSPSDPDIALLKEATDRQILQPTGRHRTNGVPQHHSIDNHHHRLQKPSLHHHRRTATTTSNAKPTISPPVVSTVVWESQVTGREFLPIAASPIFNNAFSIQQREATAVLDITAAALEMSSSDKDNSATTSLRRGSAAVCYDSNETRGEGDVINIKSPRALASCLLSPLPLASSVSVEMQQDDSGVDFQRTPPGIISEASSTSPPPILRRELPSLALIPPTTIVRPSSDSSFIEIFSTPSGSPVEPEPPFQQTVNEEGESASTLVAATPPSSPLNQISPQLYRLPHSTPLSPPPPFAATSEDSCSPLLASTKAQCMHPTAVPVPPRPQAEWALPTKDQLALAASLPIYESDGTPLEFRSLFAEHKVVVLFLRHLFCPMCQDYVSSLSSLVKQPILTESGALCPFDDDDARVPENIYGEEEAEGVLPKQVQLVLISCGKPGLVEKYKGLFDLPFRMYTDPDLKVYQALGMGKTGEVTNTSNEVGAGVAIKPSERVGVRPTSPAISISDGGRDGGYVRHGLMSGIAMVVMRALKAGMPVWENGGDIAQLGGEFVLGPGLTCAYAHRMQDPKGHAPVLDVLAAANVQLPEEILRPSSRFSADLFTLPTRGGLAPPPKFKEDPKTAPAKRKENLLSKKHKQKSASISGLSPWNIMAPLRAIQSSSLNGHMRSRKRAPVVPYNTQSIDEHGAMRRERRESFVTATLRSMGGKAPPGFKNIPPYNSSTSYGSLETSVPPSSGYHYQRGKGYMYNPDLDWRPYPAPPRPTSSHSHVEQEQSWMDLRQRDLEVLKMRKDERRRTGKAGTDGSPETTHGYGQRVFYHYPDDPTPSELSTVEFASPSVASGPSPKKAPMAGVVKMASYHDNDDELTTSDLNHELDGSGTVVAVGGFIQVSRDRSKRKEKSVARSLVHVSKPPVLSKKGSSLSRCVCEELYE